MSTFYFLVQQTMYFFIPLLIVALAGMFSERSGVTNIALDGIMIIGALSGILFLNGVEGVVGGQLALILALLVAAITGTVFSLLLAYSAINLSANQIIAGTALNLFAPAFAIYIARMKYGVQQIPFNNSFRVESVPVLGKIPVIGPMLFQNTYITTYIGIGILIVSIIVINKTKFGLRLRACGEHPEAADSVGVNVHRVRYASVLISGFLGGMGGLIFVIPTSTSFNASVSGYGFLALAVLIFGQWRPGKIFLAALFFAVTKMLASAYSGIPLLTQLPLSNTFYKMIPYVATLVALAFASKNSRAPKAAGEPYNPGG